MFRSRYKANSRYVSIEARNESLQFSSSFIARGAGVVDIKRTVDMFPLKRIRLCSHAASGLKAKGSMRARERREDVVIAQISGSKKSIFVLSLVLPLEGPRKPLFR